VKLKSLVAAGAAVCVVAAPAAAEAHSKPSPNSVRAHVTSANEALANVTRLVGSGNEAAAAIQLAENRLHTTAASREARRVQRSARGARGARRAISAYRLVATQQNRNVEAFAGLVGNLEGRLQEQAARLITTGLQGREQALAALIQLVERLPEPARAPIARVIQTLSADGQDEVGAILGVLATSGELPPNVQVLLGRALDLATGALETGLGRLEELVALLPPEAQAPVQQALAQVQTTIATVIQLLEGLLGELPAVPGAGGTGGLPDVGSLLGNLDDVLPGLGGVLPDLSGLLDGLVPGGVVPGTGGDGGGSGGDPVGGLLDGLLGGLLGGLGG
jgi:hypothetical protein